MTKKNIKILGIDPGFADTGFGVVARAGQTLEALDYGSIKTAPRQAFEQRLRYIYEQVISLIKNYQPDYLAIEQLFFYKNITTAIRVSQARGVVLLAAAQNQIPLYEYTPLQVKQALTGYGAAGKNQVGQMVKVVLHLKSVPRPDDAADALAIAICCANGLKLNQQK